MAMPATRPDGSLSGSVEVRNSLPPMRTMARCVAPASAATTAGSGLPSGVAAGRRLPVIRRPPSAWMLLAMASMSPRSSRRW